MCVLSFHAFDAHTNWSKIASSLQLPLGEAQGGKSLEVGLRFHLISWDPHGTLWTVDVFYYNPNHSIHSCNRAPPSRMRGMYSEFNRKLIALTCSPLQYLSNDIWYVNLHCTRAWILFSCLDCWISVLCHVGKCCTTYSSLDNKEIFLDYKYTNLDANLSDILLRCMVQGSRWYEFLDC
jgi:hypothetical protein